MWVRSAALRPVPAFALVSQEALEAVEAWLGDDEATTERCLNEIFEQLELCQPVLAEKLGQAFANNPDEVAMALGYFLGLTIYKAFEDTFSGTLEPISALALQSVEEALTLDEQLRGADPIEAVDSDDVIAMEQPHILGYIHEHVESALEVHADDADVDAVHAIYRTILVEVLALSYAVAPPKGYAASTSEVHA
jgi:hypothetical protein